MDDNSMVIIREASGYGPAVASALITGIFILLVAFFGYKYGLLAYFKKREHELILKRYLVEGIDRLSERIDHAIRVFLFNHETASDIVGHLEAFQEADLSVKFRAIQGHPGFMPLYKLAYLIGDDAFGKAIQGLFIFVESNSTYLNTSFKSLISDDAVFLRDYKDRNPETLKKLAAELMEIHKQHLNKENGRFMKYSFIFDELQKIASILEKRTSLTWDTLSEFRNRSEIKKSIEIVKKKSAEREEKRSSKIEQNNN